MDTTRARQDNIDELAIRALVDQFVEGWNAADGPACARPFAENADFTAIHGLRARGRELIGRGHAEILATVFRGTQLTATVNSIDYLRPDVAVADVTMRLKQAGQTWLPKQTSCGIVATKDSGVWSIAVFRNMVPFERPVAGPLDRELLDRGPQSSVMANG
jgi:uncharacterized protein (TIGR02246 family)